MKLIVRKMVIRVICMHYSNRPRLHDHTHTDGVSRPHPHPHTHTPLNCFSCAAMCRLSSDFSSSARCRSFCRLCTQGAAGHAVNRSYIAAPAMHSLHQATIQPHTHDHTHTIACLFNKIPTHRICSAWCCTPICSNSSFFFPAASNLWSKRTLAF